jgi:hypothetical protein
MQVSRKLGEYKGKVKGPLLVFIAGIHGNELSGIHALMDVFDILERYQPNIKGRLVGLSGNIKAIEAEKRFVDEDMNRVWFSSDNSSGASENFERDDLIKTISEIRNPEDEEAYFFDLHATSAPTTPFCMISDTLRNRELARLVGVPIILGLLEHLHGMLIDVTSLSGIPTILFQAGKEGDPGTIDYHKGLIWKMLKHKCALDTSFNSGVEELINKMSSFKPKSDNEEFYEIRDLFSFSSGAEFVMNPGYVNFQPVKAKEILATFKGKSVKTLQRGLVFMPTYQEQANEGFYIIKSIAPIWIKLSAKLRKIKHHDKLHWLVGVKKVAKNPLTYRIDQQITFIWSLQIFHLLGYTIIRKDGYYLYMAQREDEITPPSQNVALNYFIERSYLRKEIMEMVNEWRIPFANS